MTSTSQTDSDSDSKIQTVGGSSLSIADLIALNEEVIALVRCGVPLEQGLPALGARLSRDLQRLTQELGHDLEQGVSLDEALQRNANRIPPIYLEVVRAGLRSGRIASALENLSRMTRHYQELQRDVGRSLLYPCLILVFFYFGILGFFWFFVPTYLQTFPLFSPVEDQLPLVQASIAVLRWPAETIDYWAPIPPIVLALAVLAWLWDGRARSLRAGWPGFGLGLIPGVRAVLRGARQALWVELMALMISARMPLSEAFRKAGAIAGGQALQTDSETIAEALERGNSTLEAVSLVRREQIPSRARIALLGTDTDPNAIARSLHDVAERLLFEVRDRTEALRIGFAIVPVVVVGLVTTLIYGLLLFVPFLGILQQLATPS